MLLKDVHGKKVQTMAMRILMTSYLKVRKVSGLLSQKFLVLAQQFPRFFTLCPG